MAQVIVPYADGHGTKFGVLTDADQQSMLDDYVAAAGITARVAPFGVQYADLAALQAFAGGTWAGAVAAPSGLIPRSIRFGLSDTADGNSAGQALASISAVVGDAATANLLEPSGATPYPTANKTLTTLAAAITGFTGEQRTSN